MQSMYASGQKAIQGEIHWDSEVREGAGLIMKTRHGMEGCPDCRWRQKEKKWTPPHTHTKNPPKTTKDTKCNPHFLTVIREQTRLMRMCEEIALSMRFKTMLCVFIHLQLHYYIPPLIYVYACVHEFVVFSEKSERGRDEITSVKCVCAYHRAAGCCGPARSSPVLRRWGAAVHCGTVVEKGWEEASGRMSEQLGPAHMPPRPATPRGRKKINYNLCLIIIYLTLYTRFGSVKQYKCKIGAYQYHRL